MEDHGSVVPDGIPFTNKKLPELALISKHKDPHECFASSYHVREKHSAKSTVADMHDGNRQELFDPIAP